MTDGAAATAHLRAADPGLAPLIAAVGPCRLEVQAAPSLFAALAETIVYQQLTTRVAATILARVRDLVGPEMRPQDVLAASDGALRGAGLSRAKALAMRDLAARTAAGELPTLAEARDLDDEAIVAALTRVRGIGRWSAQMVLIFNLGRPDVLPSSDYGLRKGFALTFGREAPPPPAAIEEHGERWRPFRTAASWYLWRALEQRTGAAKPDDEAGAQAPASPEHRLSRQGGAAGTG